MHRTLLTVALILLTIATIGCVEGTEKVTLNPDGSGKAIFDVRIVHKGPWMPSGPGEPQDIDYLAKKTIGQFVVQARGVDAWKDMTYNLESDDRIHLVGTAYFKDFNALNVGSAIIPCRWDKDDAGGATLTIRAPVMPKPPAAPHLARQR